jgi:hypothetical protein
VGESRIDRIIATTGLFVAAYDSAQAPEKTGLHRSKRRLSGYSARLRYDDGALTL